MNRVVPWNFYYESQLETESANYEKEILKFENLKSTFEWFLDMFKEVEWFFLLKI